MNAWIAVVVAGLGSFCFRFAVVAVIDRWTVPAWFEHCSRYVSPASFAALAAGALLVPQGGAGPDPVLPAAAVVTVVCARRWNASVAVVAGMLAIWTAHLAGVS